MSEKKEKREISEITKKRYIKKNVTPLSHTLKVDIYRLVKMDCPCAIPDTRTKDGTYIDLDKVEKHILDNIYDIVKKNKECIKRK